MIREADKRLFLPENLLIYIKNPKEDKNMMKKLLSLLLAGVMVLGGAATVHADEGYELALINRRRNY